MSFIKLVGHLVIILILTVLTQVGGIIWLIATVISSRIKKQKRVVFPVVYLLFNLVIIPPLASHLGREKLPWFNEHLKPRNWFYTLAFRNYVNPELKTLLINSSKKSDIEITYLDANFPFYNGFPLLPHLSHSDGKKIDLSFMYINKEGKTTTKKPSTSGYGAFVNENNPTSLNCLNKGFWQYNFSKYLTFGIINELEFDSKSTKILIKDLISQTETQKIFIEPYLKQSLGLQNQNKIRFHGCQAVRHDDHIHLQIR